MTAGNGSRTSPEKLKPTAGLRLWSIIQITEDEPTKYRIHDMIRLLQGRCEVVHERDVEVVQLLRKSLRRPLAARTGRYGGCRGSHDG